MYTQSGTYRKFGQTDKLKHISPRFTWDNYVTMIYSVASDPKIQEINLNLYEILNHHPTNDGLNYCL